jgi:ubiquinone/menaquinone biosynthesis C-methylase UbiE
VTWLAESHSVSQRAKIPAGEALFVPETRVGFWFLGTHTWENRVVRVALADLMRLVPPQRVPHRPVVLDVGCGQGKSFRPLHEIFTPQRIIAIDFEPACLERAGLEAEGLPVDLRRGDIAALELADASVDVIFCHQSFHHLTRQHQALDEFYRVLKPGGLFLFAESTRAYICSWIIRLLFRHPMYAQRTAEEYLQMIRDHGFQVAPESVSYPYLWWSRSDLGLLERLLRIPPPKPGKREETLINLVATKPAR